MILGCLVCAPGGVPRRLSVGEHGGSGASGNVAATSA